MRSLCILNQFGHEPSHPVALRLSVGWAYFWSYLEPKCEFSL